MNDHRRRAVHRPTGASALALLLAAPAFGNTLDLAQLDALLHAPQNNTVPFVEHQYRKVLTAPVERRGELVYVPPATFEKHVQQPEQERYRLTDNTLTIELPGAKPRQVSTRNQPLLRSLLLGFQAVVSGDLGKLAPLYRSAVSGTASQWQLQLVPTDTQMSRYIRDIIIKGKGDQPEYFEVNERNGDRTVTEILRSSP